MERYPLHHQHENQLFLVQEKEHNVIMLFAQCRVPSLAVIVRFHYL